MEVFLYRCFILLVCTWLGVGLVMSTTVSTTVSRVGWVDMWSSTYADIQWIVTTTGFGTGMIGMSL